jgi:hypothetical protein
LSVQVPETLALPSSGPEYVFGAAQEATPEVASAPEKPTVSEWLYQPFESARRPGVAVTEGAVLSRLNVLLTVVVPPSLVALHVSVVAVVSEASVVVSQPLVERMTDSGSSTFQPTVTFVTYQPLLPSVPVIIGVTTGGLGSPGVSGSPTTAPGSSSATPRARKRAAAYRRNGR